ncbi:MAG: hypothetical protein QOG63_2980 [Thermoleophilaceae bacterium]|nr:hypothetical protein [Thermoleophilaceae bacterium]
MLREVKNAGFAPEGVLVRRHRFVSGETSWPLVLKPREYTEMAGRQAVFPQQLFEHEGRRYWAYAGRFYWEDDGLSAHDVQALVHERFERRARKLERAHAAMQREQLAAAPRREPIPRAVRLAVFNRDGGRCVGCGSGFDIQYDHVIPVAMGGATTAENLQILCADCNRRKGATLG